MDKRGGDLILFCVSYPYDKALEHTFLKEELHYLLQHFNNVYIAPQYKNDGDLAELPRGVKLIDDIHINLSQIKTIDKLKVFFNSLFYRYLLNALRSKSSFKKYISATLESLVIKSSLKHLVVHEKNTLLYSFWNDSSTLACVKYKSDNPKVTVVTRCHNFDLYGIKENDFFVPYINYVFEKVDKVFPDSLAGSNYIHKNFKNVNCEPAIMGVANPGFRSKYSTDGVFRVFSCSYMIPRKRVGLILKGIIAAANQIDQQLGWYHIGDGPDKQKMQEIINQTLPPNVSANLLGNLSYAEMMDVYKNTPADLFMNLSEKEGTPVSLMESISCGIPILVTAFGGNKEIAEAGAGFTLPENPTESQVGDMIKTIILKEDLEVYREGAIDVWKQNYWSRLNYQKFCNTLISL